jgi:hypothetical protein
MTIINSSIINRSIKEFSSAYTMYFTKEYDPRSKSKIFLSHSHLDKDIVLNIIKLLTYYGQAYVYVDWNDTSMPSVTNIETAKQIKRRIEAMDYFLILATNNSLSSKWVPWEIGIAECKKGNEKIAVIPYEQNTGDFKGSEYLNLYRKIELSGDGKLGVWEPKKSEGIEFKNWISTDLWKDIHKIN